MAVSQDDNADRRPVSNSTRGRVDTSRDEIDLGDYLGILWRRRYFVVFGAVCPALLVWLIPFFSPSIYKVTYTYEVGSDARTYRALLGQFQDGGSPYRAADANEKSALSERERRLLFDRFYSEEKIGKLAARLTEKEYRTLRDRFYSQENLDKLAVKLKENGFEEYAHGVSPATIQLEGSDTLLTVTITGKQAQDVRKISSVVRDNLENVVPMYSVEQRLAGNGAELRAAMADIEENRFNLELELESKKAISARLKALASAETGADLNGLVLHFENVHENSEYLPLPYQAQAADANIINVEQTIRSSQEKYDYYGAVLSLNERLLDEVRNKMSSYYTIGEFHSFLARTMGDYEGSDVKNYLAAYIRKIENAMSANTPLVETPGINEVPKGGLRKAGIVFIALLMITTFGAFLLEVAQKSQKPGAVKSS